ncbi:LysE family translocator [Piscinibacter sp.]|uniref:LysE family translocator n=1 Tax=Piscinibacter sp. TaxID=1903157 RepID=UPI002CA84019|nr:LysE family translocator [Albitalea sp.]HUG25555.1 LysE family translocator [Albitalea sp.]
MFGIPDYSAFCLAVLVFLALPGPGTFALLNSTGAGGFRAGAGATLGVIAGDQVLLWLAVAGVAALLAAYPLAFRIVQYGGAAYLAWIGLHLLFAKPGARSPVRIEPRHYMKQAFFITLLNPKAIIFYMAFFPLFIDPATHLGWPTFAAMAVTIAAITAAYCLTLCAFANAVASKVKAHQRFTAWLSRLAGVFLIGFGIRLIRN